MLDLLPVIEHKLVKFPPSFTDQSACGLVSRSISQLAISARGVIGSAPAQYARVYGSGIGVGTGEPGVIRYLM